MEDFALRVKKEDNKNRFPGANSTNPPFSVKKHVLTKQRQLFYTTNKPFFWATLILA
jgi:hypothetical protein